MAVLDVNEILPRTFSHKFGESPTAERKFIVTVDAPTPQRQVIDYVNILHGATHPEWSFMRMLDASMTETDRQHVELTYRYEVPKQENLDPNPLGRPDVWSFSTSGGQVPWLYYYHGEANNDVRPLVNAANDFIEGLTTLAPEVRATISGNRTSFPLAMAAEVTNSINNAPYLGGPRYTWQCNGISGQQASEVVNDVEIRYWQISVELTYRKHGYVEKLPHVGWHHIEGGRKKRIRVDDEDGGKTEAASPQPLNENGGLKCPDGNCLPDQLLRRPFPAVNFNQYFGTPPF